MTLNAKMKTRLWMPKTDKMNDFERLWIKIVALNAKERSEGLQF